MLRGREADLARVEDFVLGRTNPRYPALLVTGPPGIGKTALLEAVAAAAQQRGTRVLWSGAVEFEVGLDFGGLNQMLLPLVGGLPMIPAVHRTALEVVLGLRPGPSPSQLVVGAAVLALVGAVDAPLLLVVDDAALLDRASAMAIAYVARRVDRERARFLLSARSEVDNAFVRSGFEVHALGPLSEASADALLLDRFPHLGADARGRVRAAAEGNPLALLDLPSGLDLATAPLPDVVPLGERLRALYAGQLAGLPARTRAALLFLVLAGSETAAAAQRLPTLERQGDLSPAERLGLVRVDPDGERVEFRHPLVRAAVVESSTMQDRRHAQAALAEAFRDDPWRRAWHLGESAAWPAPEVAAELERLSDELLRSGDAQAATSSVLRAAELSEDALDRARRIGRASFLQAAFTGDLGASEELLRRARPDPSGSLPMDLVGAAAYATMSRDGDTPRAHRLLVAALEAAPDPLPTADVPTTEALHLLVLASYLAGRDDLWDETRRHLDRVRPALPPTLQVLRGVYAEAARPDDATLRRLDDELHALVLVSDALLITRLATAGAHLDRGTVSRGPLERVVEDGRAGGAVVRQIQAAFLLATTAWSIGDWDEVESQTEEGLALCDDLGYPLLAMIGRYPRALVDAVRGRDGAADVAVERLLQWAAPRGLRTFAEYASHVQCLRAIGREQFDEAYRHAASVATPGVFSTTGIAAHWSVFDLVETAWRSGHEAEARTHVDAAVAADLPSVSPRFALVVAGAAALVAAEDWGERFVAALSSPGGEQFAFDHARVRLAYGERLRRERLLVAARDQLAPAADAFQRLGARPWRERAERELRAAGGSPHPTALALTPQETAVAGLAATGLTNKEIAARLFLSPRTVSTHLSHAFAKLGVPSRRELAGALDPPTGR